MPNVNNGFLGFSIREYLKKVISFRRDHILGTKRSKLEETAQHI
jgi:hypothetical protein